MKTSPSGHLTETEVLELVLTRLGRVPGPGMLAVSARRAHLSSCGSCSLLEQDLSRSLWALELGATELSPEAAAEIWGAIRPGAQRTERAGKAVRDRVPEMLERSRAAAGRLAREFGGAVREIIASLAAEPLLAAVRGAAVGSALQVFESPEYSVSLSIIPLPEPARIRILGSVAPGVMGELPAGGRATIFGGTEVIETAVNEFGEFEAEDVPRCDLHIDLEMGTDRVQLSPIHTSGA